MTVRQSRILYRLLQGEVLGKIWLVEEGASDKKFIEDMLFFLLRILTIYRVWTLVGAQKTKVIISGKRTSMFPIDIDKVISITKNLRRIELAVEFEKKE